MKLLPTMLMLAFIFGLFAGTECRASLNELRLEGENVFVAAQTLVTEEDASGEKAAAVARAVSQLLGNASRSGTTKHILQSVMNVADTAEKVIAAKRSKSYNIEALLTALEKDNEQLGEAIDSEREKRWKEASQKATFSEVVAPKMATLVKAEPLHKAILLEEVGSQKATLEQVAAETTPPADPAIEQPGGEPAGPSKDALPTFYQKHKTAFWVGGALAAATLVAIAFRKKLLKLYRKHFDEKDRELQRRQPRYAPPA